MGILGNGSVLNKSAYAYTAGAKAICGAVGTNFKSVQFWGTRALFDETASFPDGYGLEDAYRVNRSDTGVASQTDIAGAGSISADLISARLAEAALAGTGSISDAALGQIVQGAATIAGTGSISDAAAIAVSSVAATIAGTGSISDADLSAIIPIIASLSGSGSVSDAALRGTGAMTADIIINQGLGLSESDAAVIWEYLISGQQAGDLLADAGSAGNPWAALLDDNNDAGTFGERVQKLLTVAKFLGLK